MRCKVSVNELNVDLDRSDGFRLDTLRVLREETPGCPVMKSAVQWTLTVSNTRGPDLAREG